MSETSEKEYGALKKIWKDSVWSKVISAAIIGIAVFTWGVIKSLYDKIPLGQSIKFVMLYPVAIWQILIFIALIVGTTFLLNKIKKKDSFEDGHKKLGGFTFFELYLLLSRNKVRHPEDFHGSAVHPGPVPIIQVYLSYRKLLNTGIEDGWDPYVIKILGPILMNYRLVSLANEYDSQQQSIGRYYKMTEHGNDFFTLYERYILFRDIQRKKLA